MRLIDGYLPEAEILKTYLGPYLDQFTEDQLMAESPSAGGANVLVTVFQKQITDHYKIKINYSKTVNSVRLVKKHKHAMGWFTEKQWLYSVDDPDGPKKLQEQIRSLSLCSSNQDSSDEIADETDNPDHPTFF